MFIVCAKQSGAGWKDGLMNGWVDGRMVEPVQGLLTAIRKNIKIWLFQKFKNKSYYSLDELIKIG